MKNRKKRAYDNTVREAQAEGTRNRVLDGVSTGLEGGLSELTMPAVAKAAGVSLPTVYRYFADKRALIEAAADRVRRQLGVRYDPAVDRHEFVDRMRHVLLEVAGRPAGFRVLVAASSGEPYPEDAVQTRAEHTQKALAKAFEGIRGKDRRNATTLAMVLCSSPMAIALARFRIGGSEAADLVEWAIDTMIAGIHAKKKERK